MSNSSLVCYTRISPNKNHPRNHAIDTITIHHMAGDLTVEACGAVFAPSSRQASSNYGIGSDGRVALYVDEADRSWCTSSPENDHRAVTIEVANCGKAPDWPVSAKAYAALLDLVTDICKRNGIRHLNYTGDKKGNLTMHKWYAATVCPGPYLEARFPDIAREVNRRLNAGTVAGAGLYKVQAGAFSSYANAAAQKAKIEAAGFEACIVALGSLYKVQVGAYKNKKNAEAQMAKVKEAGFDACVVK